MSFLLERRFNAEIVSKLSMPFWSEEIPRLPLIPVSCPSTYFLAHCLPNNTIPAFVFSSMVTGDNYLAS